MAFIFGLGFFKINQPWEISTFAYLQAHLNFFVSQSPRSSQYYYLLYKRYATKYNR